MYYKLYGKDNFWFPFEVSDMEEIADEMLAILNDRNRIMQKHELEETNARWNEYLNR